MNMFLAESDFQGLGVGRVPAEASPFEDQAFDLTESDMSGMGGRFNMTTNDLDDMGDLDLGDLDMGAFYDDWISYIKSNPLLAAGVVVGTIGAIVGIFFLKKKLKG